MASQVADLFIKLGLVSSEFTAGLEKAGTEAEGFTSKVGSIGEGIGKAAKVVALAGIGIAAVSVKMAGDWQASMVKLVTSAGETGSIINGKLTGPIAQVSDGLLKIATQTGTSTKALGDAMYYVESAGFHGAAGLQVMKIAAEGARAEGSDVTTVADALTTALHDMGKGADYSVPMMNMMIRAVGDGKMTMQAFAASLHSVLPQAAAAGVSFQDVSAAIATMTVAGTSADQATMMLGHTIQSLQSPNNIAVKAMATFGLSTMDLKEHLGQRGLLGTMAEVDQAIINHLGPDGTYLQNTFNNSKVATQDLNQMMSNMAPQVRDLAQQVMNGTVATKDYNTALGFLPPNLKAQGSEFLTLYKNATSFNTALRNGVPGADTFAGSLRKVLGDTVDTNTALQIGGMNLATFSANEQNVADGAKNAGDNIETWGVITHSFNFRISQLRSEIEVAAIKLGTMFLPKLMELMDLISNKGGPLLRQFGTDVSNALNSPAVHEAESVIKHVWLDLMSFIGQAASAVVGFGRVLRPVIGDLAVGFFGALQLVGGFLKNVLGPVLQAVSGFFQANAGVIHILADVALAGLIAKLLYTKSLLAVDLFTNFVRGLSSAINWVMNLGKAIASGEIFDTMRLKAMYAGDALKGFATAEAEAGDAAAVAASEQGLGSFTARLGTMIGTGALIGGVVLGLGMVAHWIGTIGQKSGDATAALNAMTGQLLDIAHSGSAANTQMAAFVVAMTKQGFVKGMNPFTDVDNALAQMVQSGNLKQAQAAIGLIDAQLKAAGLSTDKFHDSLSKFSDAAGAYVNQQREAAITTQDTTTAIQDSTPATSDATTAMQGLSQSISDTVSQQQNMSAGLQADRSLDEYKKSILDVTKSLQDNGAAITGDSAAAMNNRDAIRQSVQAMLDNYNANVQNNMTVQDATQKLKDQITQFENTATQSDSTRAAIKKYIDQLDLIPKDLPPTKITADTSSAEAAINNLQNKMKSLMAGDNSPVTVPAQSSGGSGGHPFKAYALGGFVDGPVGAPQLAIVHGGEYVVSLDEMSGSGVPPGGRGGPLMGGGPTVIVNVQGSVVAERDIRDFVQTLMLQLGARYSTSYTPYKR